MAAERFKAVCLIANSGFMKLMRTGERPVRIKGQPMSDGSDNILLFEILRQIQEGQATAGAALIRLERAVVRHDRKFGEIEQRFSQIEQRLNYFDTRFNTVQADIRDAKDELESIIKLELGGHMGMLQTHFGHRVDALEEQLAALSKSTPP